MQMKIKKILLIISVILIAIVTSSCKDQEELEDIGIVIATGLDLEDEQVVLTVEVIIPVNRVEEDSNLNSMIVQERGKSVMDAIRNVTLNFDRKLFFSHNAVIIFGEDLAKEGIINYLDFFTRDNEPRETAYLAVAKGSKAYELMGINSSLTGTTGEYLRAIIENTIFTLKSRSFTVNEFFKYFYERETPLLSVLEGKEIIKIEPMTGEIGSEKIIDSRGGAPFYKDQLVGFYTPEEMIGFNFLVDEVEEGIIVFEAPIELMEYSDVFSRIGKNTTFEIVKSRTKNTVEIVDGKPHLKVAVEIRGLIVEDNRGLNTNLIAVKNAAEKACAEQIEAYITMVIEKAQELKVDSFGINHLFYAKYPKEYNKISDVWHHEFSKMDYSIDVNLSIIRTGLTNTPSNIIKGEDY